MPAALILFFARTSRCAIVGSGTRNARAISSVVRPPRVRSVNATWESSPSAGWQHVNSSSSRSSLNTASSSTSSSTASGAATRCAFAAKVRSRRIRSIARFRAVVVEPGARIGRRALARPPFRGDRERLLGGVLGEIEVTEEADQVRNHATPLVAEDVVRQRSTSGRTSTAPPFLAAGMAAANSSASSRFGTSIR